MLSFLPGPVLGTLTALMIVLNLVFWIVPFYLVAIAKLLVPVARWRIACTHVLTIIGEAWISGNNFIASLHRIQWDIQGTEGLSKQAWYLVSANHQSWADIFVIQAALNRRVPFLHFFIKKQLIWVPLLGLAWWALDMPFMQRHSKEAIARNPDLRRQDLEATRRACERFADQPTSIANFIEGTRHTEAKHKRQASPYKHLLRPKAGGMAFVIAAMGNGTIDTLLNILIAYPPKRSASLWDLLSGNLPNVVVHVHKVSIPARMQGGDYQNDEAFRVQFQQWVDTMWHAHDDALEQILNPPQSPTGHTDA